MPTTAIFIDGTVLADTREEKKPVSSQLESIQQAVESHWQQNATATTRSSSGSSSMFLYITDDTMDASTRWLLQQQQTTTTLRHVLQAYDTVVTMMSVDAIEWVFRQHDCQCNICFVTRQPENYISAISACQRQTHSRVGVLLLDATELPVVLQQMGVESIQQVVSSSVTPTTVTESSPGGTKQQQEQLGPPPGFGDYVTLSPTAGNINDSPGGSYNREPCCDDGLSFSTAGMESTFPRSVQQPRMLPRGEEKEDTEAVNQLELIRFHKNHTVP